MRVQLTTLLLLLNLISSAQSYTPIPLNNTLWMGTGYQADGSCVSNFEFQNYTNGDSLYNGFIYTKIETVDPYGFIPCGISPPDLMKGMIRQDILTRMVYIIFQDSVNEEVLYDFNQNVGDTVNSALAKYSDAASSGTFIITKVDSMQLNGIYHHYVELDNGALITPVKFIEGIGSTNGIAQPFFFFERNTTLSCMSYNGFTAYPDSSFACGLTGIAEMPVNNTNFVSASPNPSSSGFYLSFDKHIDSAELLMHDISGELIMKGLISGSSSYVDGNMLKEGIYFYSIRHPSQVYTGGKIVIME